VTAPPLTALPRTHLTELAASEAALSADLGGRDQAWAAAPSALPGWSRGHVVGHLTGNAVGLLRLARWAASGVETPMYASPEERSAEIDRRAALPWSDLVTEARSTARELGEALDRLREPLGARTLRLGSGAEIGAWELAAMRIREIEIHRVDLGAEYRPVDWSPGFTVRTLDQVAPFFRSRREVPVQYLRCTDTGRCWPVGRSGPDLVGTEADLLAWLLGRAHPGVHTTDGSPLPSAPAWA
jgi:maleylpyruvate isomerase